MEKRLTKMVLWGIINEHVWESALERYRSGHNEAVLKTVCPQGRVGSNPTLSADCTAEPERWVPGAELNMSLVKTRCESTNAEVPKWLKGLPWKGSRSLVAARGFKSLLLRYTVSYIILCFLRSKVVGDTEEFWFPDRKSFLQNGWKTRVCRKINKLKKKCWQLRKSVIIYISLTQKRVSKKQAGTLERSLIIEQ